MTYAATAATRPNLSIRILALDWHRPGELSAIGWPACADMGFNKLQERGGSGTVTLDKGDLRLDGFVDEDGNILEQEMHVQRVGEGAYLVRAVVDGNVSAMSNLTNNGE